MQSHLGFRMRSLDMVMLGTSSRNQCMPKVLREVAPVGALHSKSTSPPTCSIPKPLKEEPTKQSAELHPGFKPQVPQGFLADWSQEAKGSSNSIVRKSGLLSLAWDRTLFLLPSISEFYACPRANQRMTDQRPRCLSLLSRSVSRGLFLGWRAATTKLAKGLCLPKRSYISLVLFGLFPGE